MKIHQNFKISVSLALGSIVSLLCLPAQAYIVDSFASFVNYQGTVGAGFQFVSTINGNTVCPDAGCGETFGVATLQFYDPITDTGTPIQNVDMSLIDNYDSPPQRPSNSLTLTPFGFDEGLSSGQNVQNGDTAVVARLRYVNGQWFSAQLGFYIESQLFEQTGPGVYEYVAGSGGIWEDTLELTVTPNNGTAANNADRLCFTSNPTWNCFYAYEPGDTPDPYAEVELLATFGSLTPVGFGNAISGGFVAPSQVVPVPAAAWLFGSGLVGLIGFARRKTRAI